MSCQEFVHTSAPDMDWICVCGHDSDWHGYGPNKPGGPCSACAEAPVCTCPPHMDGIGREKWPDCPIHTLGEHSSNPREDG